MADLSESTPTSSMDMAYNALLEADLARQFRRARRLMAGRTFSDELRLAVSGKRILVTGASSGIGRGAALRLMEAGAHVLLVARREQLLEELAQYSSSTEGRASYYRCDLSDQRQVSALVAQVLDEHGGVDVLINNAGRSIRRTVSESANRMHDYERVMQLNFFGVTWLTVPLVERMRETGGGQVINVSTAGTQFAGTPRFAAYMASKGALDQFALSAAPEMLADGIRWTTVNLPLTQTDMIAPAQDTWNRYPKLSADRGVSMVLDAVVRAPVRVTHPASNAIEVIDRVATRIVQKRKAREFRPTPVTGLPRVAIIGAGMSGLAMAMKLRAAGSDDFVIFEKTQNVGGTWRENAYPGLTCDVPAHYYCYRDELSSDWTHVFAPGSQIQNYFESVAVKRNLTRFIQFGTEIVRGEFVGGQWVLTDADGREYSADVLVCATGVLHHPRIPSIAGLESFAGSVFHSARWDHDAQIAGARVGIIGNGSTGVQITTALSETAAKVTLFQRTPQWVVAVPNPSIPKWFRSLLAHSPILNRTMYRTANATFNVAARAPIASGWERSVFGYLARRSLATVRDPELRARLTPDYEPLCKRLINSADFYRAVQRPSVAVASEAIEHVCPEGVLTSDGQLHRLDTLVLATGFEAHAYMRPMQLAGPSGLSLEEAWRAGPRAHNTTMIPGLPNLFILMGPNSPIGNASLVPIAETQADYVVDWLKYMKRHGIVEIEPTAAATDSFYREVTAALGGTVWSTGCDSWYLGPNGVPVLWPWPFDELHTRLAHPNHDDFVLRSTPTVTVRAGVDGLAKVTAEPQH
ncbi:putative monooxygenase [Mycobacteroides stephanolepidis]|uniref:Putative monooxygenase n=1 Tax=[Mycobacterium] stephanolepidis TaxID=1520670 RepID=A0A1Z4F0L6_9MYCO|nr:SDR family NAD(P)-dependent oxidoreductase [[Mycobacterium] stephanolepidis]BAX98775.1 putative monooxygenase [[Mycobacterium] stephanolepidis]